MFPHTAVARRLAALVTLAEEARTNRASREAAALLPAALVVEADGARLEVILRIAEAAREAALDTAAETALGIKRVREAVAEREAALVTEAAAARTQVVEAVYVTTSFGLLEPLSDQQI